MTAFQFHITFWKTQDYRDKHIGGCWGLGGERAE